MRIGVTSLAPRDDAARTARRVARLAAQRGLSATLMGPRSHAITDLAATLPWDRVGSSTVSRSVTIGVARLDLSAVVSAVDQPYAVGVWLPLESRLRRLHRRLAGAPDRSLVDAAVAARPVATVLIGRDPDLAMAVVGADLLATEVMGRALRAATQPVGDLGLSPWEAPVVQRGTELGAGVTHPDLIDLESIWLAHPRDRSHERFHRIVETASARAGIHHDRA